MPSKNARNRDVIRMAVRLRERLLELRKPVLPDLPEGPWRLCQKLTQQSETAWKRGWLAAAERLRPRLQNALRELQENLARMRDGQVRQNPLRACLSLRELSAELMGLFDEFAEVEFNLRARTVLVTTDPIELEDVYLGPFRIELGLGDPGRGLSYSVVATDPHPANRDEDVVHPHVRDNTLCEGEGTLPIRRALEEGRLGDFFQIVSQILHTYNPSSAYVNLDEWEGSSCTACGTSIDDEERTSCSRTGDYLCYECAVNCPGCDQDIAPALIERCQKCDEESCDRCLEQGLCHACREEIRAQEETETRRPSAETSLSGRG